MSKLIFEPDGTAWCKNPRLVGKNINSVFQAPNWIDFDLDAAQSPGDFLQKKEKLTKCLIVSQSEIDDHF